MITRLKKIDSLAAHLVNQPMLLRNSSRPHAAKLVLEWLRLTNALEWIFHNILSQKQDPKSYFPVKSCRNSGWNAASPLTGALKAQLTPQLIDGFWLAAASICSAQSGQQSSRVLR